MQATELTGQGIAAAKAGRRDEARGLLVAAVEADEQQEAAWLWLAGLVDDPADQIVALENALTINPTNREAERKLWQLRSAVTLTPNPSPARGEGSQAEGRDELGPSPYLATQMVARQGTTARRVERGEADLNRYREGGYQQTLVEAGSEVGSVRMADFEAIADPDRPLGATGNQMIAAPPPGVVLEQPTRDEQLACPYCDVQTKLSDQTCSSCRGELWFSYRVREKRSQALAGLFIFWLAQASRLIGQFAFSATLAYYITELNSKTSPLLDQKIEVQKLQNPVLLLIIYGGLAAACLVTAVGSMLRIRQFYYVNIGMIIVLGIESVLSFVLGVTHWGWMILGLGCAVVLYWLLISTDDDFFFKRERIVAPPDERKGHSALDYHNDATRYLQSGFTAMAARAWRKAIALKPRDASYRLSLAGAYLKLKQYPRAEAELHQTVELEPDNLRAINLLALALANQSRFAEAEAAVERAIRLKPDDELTRENRAGLLKMQRTAQEGVK